MWCVIELNLGIFGGCVTVMRPFVRRYFPRLLGLSSNGSKSAYAYPSQSRGNSHPLASIPRSEQPGFSSHAHQFSTTFKTHNSSEEHILPSPGTGKELDGIVRTVEFDVKQSGGEGSGNGSHHGHV